MTSLFRVFTCVIWEFFDIFNGILLCLFEVVGKKASIWTLNRSCVRILDNFSEPYLLDLPLDDVVFEVLHVLGEFAPLDLYFLFIFFLFRVKKLLLFDSQLLQFPFQLHSFRFSLLPHFFLVEQTHQLFGVCSEIEELCGVIYLLFLLFCFLIVVADVQKTTLS
jgi:uncharacterized membrane protein